MYPNYLGKFNVPANDPEWAGKLTYTPEPPVTVRGSMNPWETERQREVWLGEEAAWKEIQPKQAAFRAVSREMSGLMNLYNAKVSELERVVGRPVGLEKMSSFTQKVPLIGGMAGGIMGMVGKILGKLTGGLFGGGAKKKKRRAERLIKEIEGIQAQLAIKQQQILAIQSDIEALIQRAEGIRATQPARAQAAIQQSETAYVAKRQLDRTRADVLRERIRQLSTLPRSGGSYNAEL